MKVISILLVFFFVVALWLCLGHIPARLYGDDLPSAGQYGDSFGFVNSLFSALTLGGVIFALWFQMQELRLQRNELKKTTEALLQQHETARMVARIHGLTYLAEFHQALCDAEKESAGGWLDVYRNKRDYYAQRAIYLMKRLGETFPDDPKGDV